jgi:hypothetical protein
MTITTSAVPDADHTATDVGAGADPEAVIRLRPEQVGQHPDSGTQLGRLLSLLNQPSPSISLLSVDR